ncbi:MAG TPA: hypothetical protein VKC17_11030 [Sphingomicrobium sp.]|jgi:hypothetical protein|nr:hypothetical protein [Sphingomicrobium sp.]
MKEIFGGILMAVGILIAGGSGLCSMIVLFDSGEFSGFGMWQLVLLVGGIPFAVGAGITYGGYALLRSARRNYGHETPNDDQAN